MEDHMKEKHPQPLNMAHYLRRTGNYQRVQRNVDGTIVSEE